MSQVGLARVIADCWRHASDWDGVCRDGPPAYPTLTVTVPGGPRPGPGKPRQPEPSAGLGPSQLSPRGTSTKAGRVRLAVNFTVGFAIPTRRFSFPRQPVIILL